MTTTPDDASALFGVPPPPSPASPASPPASGASGSKSGGGGGAGTAFESPLGGVPVPAADGRREQRTKVSWPGRIQLPNGQIVELRVRDISEGGVGLVSDVRIPAYTVVNFAMGVPPLNEGDKMTPVSGTIKTTYMVVQGQDIYCGGSWVQVSAASRELVDKWMRRLRR
jgi:hypothetical protein